MREGETMDKAKITGFGGLLAGVLGSACCVGPAIFVGLGFGVSTASFLRDFGFLHIPMMILAFLLLGTAFYIHYRKGNKENPVTCEVTPGKRPRNGIFLWVATALTLSVFIYPYLR